MLFFLAVAFMVHLVRVSNPLNSVDFTHESPQRVPGDLVPSSPLEMRLTLIASRAKGRERPSKFFARKFEDPKVFDQIDAQLVILASLSLSSPPLSSLPLPFPSLTSPSFSPDLPAYLPTLPPSRPLLSFLPAYFVSCSTSSPPPPPSPNPPLCIMSTSP